MTAPLKHLDLFSGIGGFALGLKWAGGFETVAFCEIDPYCQKVLAKNFPGVKIYDDVRTLDHDGPVDIITGGYPCQPFSMAGKRKGEEDDRHLWPAMFDLIKKYRPTWVIGENVAGHISMGLDDVLADLEGENYTVRTVIIPAVAVDAKHRRDRLWIVAHTTRQRHGQRGKARNLSEKNGGQDGQVCREPACTSEQSQVMADTNRKRQLSGTKDGDKPGNGPINRSEAMANGGQAASNSGGTGRKRGTETGYNGRNRQKSRNKQFTGRHRIQEWATWPTESGICRVASGVPRRVDRLKGLGNAVVPQIPEIIGRAIINSMRKAA